MTIEDRNHSLDALRAGALLLGIALHATMSFLPGFREVAWPISDVSESTPLALLFFVVHIFRMAVFFVVAGFFARLLFHRLGVGGFIKNRLRRIALPLLAFYPLIMPLTILPIIWAAHQLAMTTADAAKAPPMEGFPWGHFWFLYLLLVLYVLLLVLRSLVVAMDRRGGLRARVDRGWHILVSSRVAALFLAAPLAALLYVSAWWPQWMGIPAPLAGFVPNAPALLGFGMAVLLGWQLHRQQSLLDLLRRDWALHLTAGVIATLISLYLVGTRPQFFPIDQPSAERAAYAIAYSLALWCWTLGLIGAALAWLSAPSARWRYLADGSYWMYLVHVPIVWGLQAWMIRWPVHWAVKYSLILAISAVVLFASYHYLVRSTFLGKFLNGRKYPRSTVPVTPEPNTSPG